MVKCISAPSACKYFGLSRAQIKALPGKILKKSSHVWYYPLDEIQKQHTLIEPIPSHIIKDLHPT